MEEQTDMNRFSTWLQKRWKQLKYKIELAETNTSPIIHKFYTDELFITEQGKLNLYWELENAHYVTINQRVGEVTGRNSIIVRVAPNVTAFTLTAYGGFKKVTQTIQLDPVRFRDDKRPLARVSSVQISMKLPKLRAKRSESTKKERRFQQAGEFETPKLVVNLPMQPQAAELGELRETLQEAFKIKEVAVLEARLKELKRTDLLEKLTDIDYNEATLKRNVSN